MTDKYIVIDLETSIKNRGEDAIGKNKADPFVSKNKIVWSGWKIINGDGNATQVITRAGYEIPIKENDLIVGQNIKFDLHYLMRKKENKEALKTASIWDTQLAEYILTGQQSKMVSLDTLSQKYGGTVKDDKIKE